MPQTNLIERAYQIAASGKARTVEDIRDALKREGYASVEMNMQGMALRRSLRDLCRAHWKASAGRLAALLNLRFVPSHRTTVGVRARQSRKKRSISPEPLSSPEAVAQKHNRLKMRRLAFASGRRQGRTFLRQKDAARDRVSKRGG